MNVNALPHSDGRRAISMSDGSGGVSVPSTDSREETMPWVEQSTRVDREGGGDVGVEDFQGPSSRVEMMASLPEMMDLERVLDDHTSGYHDGTLENMDVLKIRMNEKRYLRSNSRAAQSSTLFDPAPGAMNVTDVVSQPPIQGADTMDTTGKGPQDFLLTIILFLILSPCVFASFAQAAYCVKKRRRDRRERELMEVSTNPTSRMLVLSEIFKNDSRAVTEDDASPKKKRVLVKKHRKRTRSEHQGKSGDEMDANVASSEAQFDEEIGRRPRDDSNETEPIGDQNDEPWWSEEEDVLSTASDQRPMIVYISENIEDKDVKVTDEAIDEDNISTLEGEEKEKDNFASERSQDEALCRGAEDLADGDVAGGVLGKTIKAPHLDSEPNLDSTHQNNENGTSEDEHYIAIGTTPVCNEGSNGSELEESMNTGESDGDLVEAHTSPEHVATEPDGATGASSNTTDGTGPSMKSSTSADTPQRVSLVPKVSSRQFLNEDTDELEEGASQESPADATETPKNGPDIPPLSIEAKSPKNYLPPRTSSPHPSLAVNDSDLRPPSGILAMPDLSADNSDDEGEAIHVDMNSIFRGVKDDEEEVQSIPEIHACGSSVTEVTSNVELLKETGSSFDDIKLEPIRTLSANESPSAVLFHPYQLQEVESGAIDTLSGLGEPIPMKRGESSKSTDASVLSSNVSYFSYEDVSIASEEAEMCAICICPYEEGDIRIFSKRCPHVFHKECILEWLVKSHNECPCCRIDMVTNNEIREISAALMGTERLAQAMAVVNASEMQEAPPFRGRVRRPRLARQMLERARARAQAERRRPSGDTSSMPPNSPNSHWLWTERFGQPTTPSMPPLSEGDSSSNTPTTPTSNNVTVNIHNRDWLWATRFSGDVDSSFSSIEQPRTINPSRSSDAIMNPHEANQSTSVAPATATPTHDAHMHNTTAGSLFSTNNASMFHDHWQRRSQESQRRTGGAPTLTLSPNRRHSHWRQAASNRNTESPMSPNLRHPRWRQGTRSQSSSNSSEYELPELPVTVLPAI